MAESTHGTDHTATLHASAPAADAHAVAGDVHDAAPDAHAAGHHAPELGRHLEHPLEPPHIIQILWKTQDQGPKLVEWKSAETKKFIAEYTAKNGSPPGEEAIKKHLEANKPHMLETDWLATDSDGYVTYAEDGSYIAQEGKSPSLLTALHVGTLKKPIPLINYAPWENHVYFALAAIVLIGIFYVATASFRRDRNTAMRRPSRSQLFIETIVGGFDEFCKGILGEKHGRYYMPFIGTLFCFLIVANFMGMFPALKAPTSYVVVTFSLALCTFIVVQATAWSRLGPGGYIYHLMGQPKDAFGWFLGIILFLPLEIISDFLAKPLSLALRLFGNIFGKDILLGVFMTMGIAIVAGISPEVGAYVGIPLTAPFLFLGMLFSTIQALVFALLSAIYISLVLPHEHDDHDHDSHGPKETHGHKDVHEAIPS